MGNDTAAIRKRNAARKARFRALADADVLTAAEGVESRAGATQEFARTTQLEEDVRTNRTSSTTSMRALTSSASASAEEISLRASSPANAHLRNAGRAFRSADTSIRRDDWNAASGHATRAVGHVDRAVSTATSTTIKRQARTLRGASRIIEKRAKARAAR